MCSRLAAADVSQHQHAHAMQSWAVAEALAYKRYWKDKRSREVAVPHKEAMLMSTCRARRHSQHLQQDEMITDKSKDHSM